jgi:putative flippase GtrA
VKNFLLKKRQFLFYCLIGGCGTACTCLSYALLVKFAGMSYQLANAIGYAVGTAISFLLNARFNFRVSDKLGLRLIIFFSIAFAGWLVSAGLLYVLVGRCGLNAYYAYLIVIIAVVLLQYNLNRLISFKK